ncbi:LEAF RUST 10 DISEASE-RESISTANCEUS RECEPTOR-LIKE PROTEIN KINASE-like 2.2 [Aristolochia californica]|uniref:LEAF RUST 10 DISEASE-RESISTANCEUS RECEPTOR-LIKE PROTEIN KINASE-like 2.2 n=1 Tax=Aristolochia californica TaxID=171875 RepID=UPI0035D839E3
MHNIAVETARGILYLHEGCINKILHLDIKPHDVLIDSNLTGTVANFGLARLIDEDNNHLSFTHAPGTPRYATPEIWTKAYGPITDKSDVFSYGMLLLEMAGRMKYNDSSEENTTQANFLDWVFKKAGIRDPKVKSMI